VAAALVVLATVKRGPALSPDSAVYLSVADHLAHGRGWTQFDGAPYVRWAPLYPFLLSLGPRLGGAAATVAQVLQPLFLAGSVALCGAWLTRHVRGAGWRIAALALVALSTIGIESAAFVWSESLDLLLTLGCLVALDAWLTGGRPRALALATACAALACLTRYASIVLVPVGALAILLAPGMSARKRVLGAALFSLGAALPIAGWMVRNVGMGAGPLGATAAAGGFSWAQLAAQASNAASHWVSPESSPPLVRAAALVLFAMAAAATLVSAFARTWRARSEHYGAALLLAFVGAHKLAVLGGAHAAAVEGIEERYLAPLFAPLVLALAWAADRATASPARLGLARPVLAALAALWIAFTALRTADRERGYLGDGAWGLNNARWERSSVLQAARRRLGRGTAHVESNAPDALYALAGIEARLSPRKHAYHSPETKVDDLERFQADGGPVTLVWFAGADRSYLAAPEELARLRPREILERTADGELDLFLER